MKVSAKTSFEGLVLSFCEASQSQYQEGYIVFRWGGYEMLEQRQLLFLFTMRKANFVKPTFSLGRIWKFKGTVLWEERLIMETHKGVNGHLSSQEVRRQARIHNPFQGCLPLRCEHLPHASPLKGLWHSPRVSPQDQTFKYRPLGTQPYSNSTAEWRDPRQESWPLLQLLFMVPLLWELEYFFSLLSKP